MIFCTAGTQAPFDRFLKMVDNIAPSLSEEVVIQVFRGKYNPKNVRRVDFLAPDDFEHLFSRSRLIVAHAGMGTIVNAMFIGKPIVVVPRIAALGEHRNEHQLATVRRMEALKYVYSAYDEQQLFHWMSVADLPPLHVIGPYAQQSLIDEIRRVIG